MYDIKYVEGTLTINPAEATIVVPDITKVYGEPDPEKVATVEGLIDPDSIPDEDLKVGRKTSPRYEAGGRTYLDELIPAHGTYPDWYNEHYPNYTFTIDMGDLTISEREVTVSVADKTVDYNNAEQTGETEYTFSNVLAEQTATITYTASKGINAGTYKMTMSESDFAYESENFNVTFNVTPGEFKINKRTLTLTSASDEKEYDGTPLTNDTVTVDGELAETDDIEFTVTGKQIEAGSSPNYFTYQFVKKGGAEVEGSALAKAMSAFATVSAADASGDIAANYNIDVNYGTLTVTAAAEPDNDDDVDDIPDKKTDNEKSSSETKTGDSAKLGGTLALMMGALLGLLGLIASGRREEQE